MSVTDIRPLKTALRSKYRAVRRQMLPDIRKEADRCIAERIRLLQQYQACITLLAYVSTDIEVDTLGIINNALKDGKRVAVPRCVDGTRRMEFYYITCIDELQTGSFGVLEPSADPQRLITEFSSSICLVPALSYDHSGYRLGYGKGYYDRFLANYDGYVVGICYSNCVQASLPHGRYDRRVSLLVTEQSVQNTVV